MLFEGTADEEAVLAFLADMALEEGRREGGREGGNEQQVMQLSELTVRAQTVRGRFCTKASISHSRALQFYRQ